ncbi:MAG TPA: S8 family serine peptidase [Fervidobacterium sp.]|nr:S8 family serine peptidase [Fervidobacterium sp.]HQE47780.1 S8 family serine peptidase [Fervidobacterium sp.]HUM43411.1 S8 family serine peptidase [Fervidobacterium sp.]
MHKRIYVLLISIFIPALGLIVLTSCTTSVKTPHDANLPYLNSLEYEYEEGKILIGYNDQTAIQQLAKIVDGNVQSIDEKLKVATIKLNSSVETAYKLIKQNGDALSGIDYIEPSYKRCIPYFHSDIALNKSNSIQTKTYVNYTGESLDQYLWGVKAVLAKEMWDNGYLGNGVTVAVLDTGIDATNPELQGQVIKGYSASSDKEIPAGTDSSYGGAHGTHVSGTIAAKKDGRGIVGISPNVKLMPIVIFSPFYAGDERVAAGIEWAVDNGAKVLSNSWGGLGYSITLKRAIDYALSKGVVVVVAAGNSTSYQSFLYPANYPGVIQVGAVENTNPYRTANFSNRSPMLSVGAPGKNILSTVPQNGSMGYEGGFEIDGVYYDIMSGTSMATPHVSALAALILQKYPNAQPWQVRKLLQDGAQDIDDAGIDPSSGYGLISSHSLELPLPTTGGCNLKVRVTDGATTPSGISVSLIGTNTDGKNVRYFALTDSGIAEFFSIDTGEYNIIIGGSGKSKELTTTLSTNTTIDIAL